MALNERSHKGTAWHDFEIALTRFIEKAAHQFLAYPPPMKGTRDFGIEDNQRFTFPVIRGNGEAGARFQFEALLLGVVPYKTPRYAIRIQ